MSQMDAVDFTKSLKTIVPEKDGEPNLTLRKVAIVSVNGDGTADVTMQGALVPNVPILAGATVSPGQNVQVLAARKTLLILGTGATPSSAAMPSAFFNLGTPSIANNVATDLVPTSVPVNDGAMWPGSGASFTVPVGQDGLYELALAIRYTGQATSVGQRQAIFVINGTDYTYSATTAVGLNGTGSPAFAVVRRVLSAGDVVTFRTLQNSGGALTLNSSSHGWLERVH